MLNFFTWNLNFFYFNVHYMVQKVQEKNKIDQAGKAKK